MPGNPLYIFFGHHKCATMWWNRIFAAASRKLGLKFHAVYDERGFDGDLPKFIKKNQIEFLSHGNADLDHTLNLPDFLGVHIIRDPRDIAVSAYFSHLHSHSVKHWSELEDYRDKLRGMSQEEGLSVEIRNRAKEFSQIAAWNYEQPNVLEIRFEDLASTSYETVLRAFSHLDLIDESDYRWRTRVKELMLESVDSIGGKSFATGSKRFRNQRLSGAEILAIAWQFRFQTLAGGRSPGDEDVKSHFRKGRPGDWVNHFTEDHKSLFKELYPDLLVKLGYEVNDNW